MQLARAVLALSLAACAGERALAPGHADASPDVAAAPFDAEAEAAPDGGPIDISTSTQSLVETETFLAVSGESLVAAWIDISGIGGGSQIGYRVSRDLGRTWGAVQQIEALGGRMSSDPVVAADPQGDLYLSWVGFNLDAKSAPIDMQIYAAKAPAGADAFGAPLVLNDPSDTTSFLDKPWVTATEAGTLLVTYAAIDTAASRARIIAARSEDGGSTWQRAEVASGANQKNLAMPCAGGGAVHVVYLGDEGIALRHSDDDGRTFPNATIVAPNPNLAFDDPACVAAGDDVWVAWAESTPGGTADSALRIARSVDRGASFGAPASVSDQPLAYHPFLAREAGGALDLVYYAGARDLDTAGSFRRARSADGTTWGASAPVMEGLTFLTERYGVKWLGDYAGLVESGGVLYTTFTENTRGTSHVAFARLSP
jgi:hypothetical protein